MNVDINSGVVRYAMIPINVLRDDTISIEAKGLYSYLHSIPGPKEGYIDIPTKQLKRDVCDNVDLIRDWLEELSSKQLIALYKCDYIRCEIFILSAF